MGIHIPVFILMLKQLQEDKMDNIRRNIYIDRNLWLKLKILAAEESESMSNIIEKQIKELLKEKGKIKEGKAVI